MFDWLFPDPAKKADPYLDQIEGKMSTYYQPYIGAGKNALTDLMERYGMLLNDPGALMNKMGAGYQPSLGYQFQLGEGQRSMNQGAAAGGMAGTPQERAELAKYSQGLADQDYGSYMDRILGLYGQGLQGEQGINQMGYGASGQMAQSLKDMLESKAGLAYSGQASQNKNLSDILKALSAAAGGKPSGS